MCKKLLLIWRAPESKTKHVIAELEKKNNSYNFKYKYPEVQNAISNGFDFFPGFECLDKIYSSTDIFPSITTRLFNKTRPDYLDILEKFKLTKDSTDWDILKRTKGKLITDNYEFVPFFENEDEFIFEVEVKLNEKQFKIISKDIIKINQDLELAVKKDDESVKLLYKKYEIGYIPTYYSNQIINLLREKIKYSLKVISINPKSIFKNESVSVSLKFLIEELNNN